MRTILHAKFRDDPAEPVSATDKVPRTQLHNSSAEEFKVALTKARAAWCASRGPTRTAICNARITRRR